MLRDLGHEVSALGVARLYADFVDLFVIDQADAGTSADGNDTVRALEQLGMQTLTANTIMNSAEDKRTLASVVLDHIFKMSISPIPTRK